jgi:hypothetical protein
MTDLERLIFLDMALRCRGQALGPDGFPVYGFGMLSQEEFSRLESERRALIRKLAKNETQPS